MKDVNERSISVSRPPKTYKGEINVPQGKPYKGVAMQVVFHLSVMQVKGIFEVLVNSNDQK